MYTLKVEASFSAAHRLPEYHGKCRRLHGHRWVVQASYEGTELDNQGMIYDLTALQRTLRLAVTVYDHESLNTVLSCTPTAENLARIIFERLQKVEFGKSLVQVAVEESPGEVVTYREDEGT